MKRYPDEGESFNAAVVAIVCFLLLLIASGADSQTIMFAGGGSSNGTVQSVAATVPSYMTIGGSPITTTGTFTFAFGSQSQGIVFASPCSGAGVPVFRSLCAADVPTIAQSQVSGLTTSLAAKEATANKNVANGYAGLDAGGKIISTQLPSIAITDTFVVASQAAMLALTAETGDVVIRTDTSNTYILRGTDPTSFADWSLLATPADNVTSVAGRTGAVTLSVADVSGAETTANKDAVNGYAGLSASGKVAGTEIVYGSTASTAAQGNDSRLSDARTPTAHASTHAAVGSDPVTLTEAQITNLTSDLSGKQAAGNYITALTGDGTAAGPGSVALTLATVNESAGTFGSSTTIPIVTVNAKGLATTITTTPIGNAPTASALAANGTNCSAGNYALGVDASGNAEGCTAAPTAGANVALSNLASVAINADLVTGAGTAAKFTATAPSVSAASQAGTSVTLTASPAVDGSSTHAAATGGSINLTPGAAVNSGTAGGVNITNGNIYVNDPNSGSGHGIFWKNGGANNLGIYSFTVDALNILVQGSNIGTIDSNGIALNGRSISAALLSSSFGTSANSLQMTAANAKPTCNSAGRGTMYYTPGGTGVADVWERCNKNSSDVYAWTAF